MPQNLDLINSAATSLTASAAALATAITNIPAGGTGIPDASLAAVAASLGAAAASVAASAALVASLGKPVTGAGLTIDPPQGTLSLAGSNTGQFGGVGGTAPYTFASSNPAVATVDGNGLVTGASAGVANITVTDSVGATAIGVVTVGA